MPKRITPSLLRNTKPDTGKRVEIMDATLTNFGVRVSEHKRSYFILYRNAQGRQRRYGITKENLAEALPRAKARSTAKTEDSLNLEITAARIVARGLFDQVSLGQDVGAQQATSESAPGTWGALLDTFLREYVDNDTPKKRQPLRPKTRREYRRMIDKEIRPKWEKRRLRDVTKTDVEQLLREKGSHKYAANRLLQLLRRIGSWSVKKGHLSHSPTMDIELFNEPRRDRDLTNRDLRALWPAFDAEGFPFGSLCKLLLLTGARRDELRLATWGEVDLDEQSIRLRADRTKSDRPHFVVLSDVAADLIRSFVPEVGNKHVFFGRSGVFSGLSKAKGRIDKTSDVEDWRLHDLRHSVATNLTKLGTPRHIVSKILNHAERDVTGLVYTHYEYVEERRDALNQWADYLMAVVNGEKIAPIRRAG